MFVKTVEETSLFPLIAEVIIDSKKKKKHEKLHLRAKDVRNGMFPRQKMKRKKKSINMTYS